MKKANKKLQWWLDEYSKSHQHPTNKVIHYFCVPAIVISLMGLFMCIPTPNNIPEGFDYCSVAIFLSLIFYAKMSLRHTAYMTVFFLFCYFLNYVYAMLFTLEVLLYSCVSIFIFSWFLQFVGHLIEGKKPSFLLDIQFLLIGPLWIIDRLLNSSGN